ncbi:baseplate wedge subunit [Maribacter phage Colly_1]|uniref:Baseplate wedge subunit n=1 Tax=Maribacter phage Colly_1 TaxID=2745691 RepID=A0A8E4XZS7_9CAUD|nr:baseplate wedge subunit [Maribacter phage Colly_1]QQO97380.1 baseplate wedge subunit [Maribacter phage Colly_1]
MSKNTLVGVINIDRDTMFQRAVDIKNLYPNLIDWDIENDNDALRVILDAYYLGIEDLGKFANNLAQEFSMASAITRTSVEEKAFLAGYNVTRRACAVGVLTINFDTGISTVIPAYGLVLSGDGVDGSKIFVENVNPITLAPADTSLEIEVAEGRSKTITYKAKGLVRESFLIQDKVIDSTIVLTVNSTEWSQVYKITGESASTDTHYQLREVGDNNYTIVVGDGVNGALLEESAIVEISYRVGQGTNGNIPVTNIDRIELTPSSRIIGVQDTEDELVGGTDLESIEKIKAYAPRRARIQNTIGNKFDMDIFLQTYPGIGRARSFPLGVNTIKSYILLTSGSVTETFLNNLNAVINSGILIFNLTSVVEEVEKVTVDIGLDIIYRNNYNEKDLEETIKQTVLEILNPFYVDGDDEYSREFGSDLLSSDIIAAVEGIAGVVSVAITSPTPVSAQVLIEVDENQVIVDDGSTVSVTMNSIENTSLKTSRNDKYLFNNPTSNS